MVQNNRDFDDLASRIQQIVDRAINARDFQQLNQTIRNTVSQTVDLGTEAVRKTIKQTNQVVQNKATPPKPLTALYGSTGKITSGGVARIAGGAILSGTSFLFAGVSMVIEALIYGSMTGPVTLASVAFLGGIALILSGSAKMNMVKRFKTYRHVLGDKTQCSLEKLASAVGKNTSYVRRDVRRMIDDRLFLQGHLDKEQTMLITSHETYQNFEASRLRFEEQRLEEAREQKKIEQASQDARVREVLERGRDFAAQLRQCNDDIPGEEISAKIYRMERTVRRIFQRAQEHPKIVPDLKKLMEYYLPMTIKLLKAYADMDAQPIQGENIAASKKEIEDTLDTLNLAFEKLLDDLFRDTAMDVSSDISVLQTLLAQEGLTGDEFKKLQNQKEN